MTLRLIDVHKLKVVARSFDDQYCALSYIWGLVERFRAKRTYCEEEKECPGELCMDLRPFLPSSAGGTATHATKDLIPKTITDAIEVTRLLGETYLWVDSVCILQEPEELAASIPNMDIIYKKALLTIVGAVGSDSNAGLPRSHPGAPRIHQTTGNICGRRFLVAQPSLDLVLQNSVWNLRGWTFQESKLSSRQLIFTSYGVYFRCQMDTWAEDSPEKIVAKFDTRRARRQTVSRTSHNTPENKTEASFADYTFDARLYTARQLSRQEDALNAFAGLTSNFARTTLPTQFLWGLPKEYLDAALLWKSVDHWEFNLWVYRKEKYGSTWGLPKLQRSPPLQRRPGFPSWSWCGWQGHIGYYPRFAQQPELQLLKSIESCVEWPLSGDGISEIENWERDLNEKGVLTLRGWIAMVDFSEGAGFLGKGMEKEWVCPLDAECPLLHGKHECVLLSRQVHHPIMFQDRITVLDGKLTAHRMDFINIMVIGRSRGHLAFRRGLGLMREDIWQSFQPFWSTIRLS